jgi:glutathione S-transferase
MGSCEIDGEDLMMRLFDATGPNPRVVRMFMLEKGLDVPAEVLVLSIGEARTAEHLARNPLGEVPVLETDSGAFISEALAICEYLEELHPEPMLIGRTAVERGETRMWTRRVDLRICEPIVYGFKYSPVSFHPDGSLFPVDSHVADAMKTLARANLDWFDRQLQDRAHLCGERYSLADILLYCFLQYRTEIGQPLRPEWTALASWFARVAARPAAAESAQCKLGSKSLDGTV